RCFAKCSGGVSNVRLRSCIILFKNFENNGSELIRTGGLVERLRSIRDSGYLEKSGKRCWSHITH
ncbi:hypothetical protein, partial [Methylocucumis oryzae]|uniref:hypothetical protein n=1 Tax=Methylocucumis oryzae TaxID=1632867 RepID=UPI0019553612